LQPLAFSAPNGGFEPFYRMLRYPRKGDNRALLTLAIETRPRADAWTIKANG
jgi:hypothetical protein